MNFETVIKLIGLAVSGLVAITPLVVELVKYVKKSVMEKNWINVLNIVMDLMSEAEIRFTEGSLRKDWVMSMLQASASSINYDLDMAEISRLIDDLCSLTKAVNVK